MLDESGKQEQWSERLGEPPTNLARPKRLSGAKIGAPENSMPNPANQVIDENFSSPSANAGGHKKIYG